MKAGDICYVEVAGLSPIPIVVGQVRQGEVIVCWPNMRLDCCCDVLDSPREPKGNDGVVSEPVSATCK